MGILFILWLVSIAMAFLGGRYIGHLEGKSEAETDAHDKLMTHLRNRSDDHGD